MIGMDVHVGPHLTVLQPQVRKRAAADQRRAKLVSLSGSELEGDTLTASLPLKSGKSPSASLNSKVMQAESVPALAD